jgi:AraC-like DNA-binding protein
VHRGRYLPVRRATSFRGFCPRRSISFRITSCSREPPGADSRERIRCEWSLATSSSSPTAGRKGTSAERYPNTVLLGPEGSPRTTSFVCGFLGCDSRPFNPLLASLPRRLLIPGAAEGWLSQFPKQVVTESRNGRVGSETMLTRMAELMFIEVVRRHVEEMPTQHSGWLAGLRDAVVGPALTCLHERPTHPWTLQELAREIASSRTVLVERFSNLVGVPPMLYLTRWRLQLAAEQLARGSAKVAAVGAQVGYESEAAFSRAFKRETGLSPAAWRRNRQQLHA